MSDLNRYTIITDSACDLPDGLAKRMGVQVLPLTYTENSRDYPDNLDRSEADMKRFYEKLRGGAVVTTTAVSVEAFYGAMEKQLSLSRDIICILFASGLSLTYQNAKKAADRLRERFPERKILCIDSSSASLGEGLLVYLAATAQMEGMAINELKAYVDALIPKICHFFTVDDLSYLRRGGRISDSGVAAGHRMNIRSTLLMDENGRLIAAKKMKGRTATIKALLKAVKDEAVDPAEQSIFISHGDCVDDAKELEALIRLEAGAKEIITNYVGPVIGAHSGPGTLAVFFIGRRRIP